MIGRSSTRLAAVAPWELGVVREVARDEVAGLGIGPFAVRSSGITEDGADLSHAGMYESILDVGADGLAEATDRVRASATSARAKAYASGTNERMAVLVQRMIQPVAAGVALTAVRGTADRTNGRCKRSHAHDQAGRVVCRTADPAVRVVASADY